MKVVDLLYATDYELWKGENEVSNPTLFHAWVNEKEKLSQGGCAAYLCPRLTCDSLQPWWDPMGAGSRFTNLPVSESGERLQSGGHMGG